MEAAAFALKENEISPVIPVANQFVILKCERQIPARQIPLEQVKPVLIETLREEKLRTVSEEIFSQLQERAQVRNILNDPAARKQMPGVVALINGQRGERARTGRGLHRSARQGSARRHDQPAAAPSRPAAARTSPSTTPRWTSKSPRAASRFMRPKEDGSADIEGWLQTVTAEQNVSVEAYRQTAVWPTVALKKLVGDHVTVTEEDLKNGYEANFGPRAKCLAIVFNNLRIAQQVWALAQKNPTPEYFGDLAEQYSVEASSRTLRGEVPPIQKHGGQPAIEEAAFRLAPGELSSIVQTGPELYVHPALAGHDGARQLHVDRSPRRNPCRHLREEAARGHGRLLSEAARLGDDRQFPGWHQPVAAIGQARAASTIRCGLGPPNGRGQGGVKGTERGILDSIEPLDSLPQTLVLVPLFL